jgi:N-acetylmuramoyl-L-alanine amidase
MRKLLIFCGFLFLLSLSGQLAAKQVRVDSLRFWTAPDSTRLVFGVSSNPVHNIFLLDNPRRLVIDFKNTYKTRSIIQPPSSHLILSRIRSAPRNKNNLRVVIDLKKSINPKSFVLKPNKKYGHRLVVDLKHGSKLTRIAKTTTKPTKRIAKKTAPSPIKTVADNNHPVKTLTIAIDAGHGGEDSGAIGSRGTQEKKVVLSIAKRLERMIHNHPGMQAVMVRDGDYYVGLRERMTVARKSKADLFISIHADAFKRSAVNGASVYTLSNKGASSEAARWLAKHENAADLVGGVSLDNKSDMLKTVLLDLSQTATQDASFDVGGKILNNFGRIGRLHSQTVQNAGFVVLKSPDIPSILVETAFISNPGEERKLRSSIHQQKMAKAIFNGILDYFQYRLPAEIRMATTKHKISRGETLSEIAVQYGISMKQLRSVNSLKGNKIRIGQTLSIPQG